MENHEMEQNGVLTQEMDVGSRDFEDFQFFILSKSRSRTGDQKIVAEIASVRFEIMKYLEVASSEVISLGVFLRKMINAAGIRQNRFAEYIGLRASNFNKILRGERRLNPEQAIIIGEIFDMDPSMWMSIQTKDDLFKISSSRNNYSKYSLEELREQ